MQNHYTMEIEFDFGPQYLVHNQIAHCVTGYAWTVTRWLAYSSWIKLGLGGHWPQINSGQRQIWIDYNYPSCVTIGVDAPNQVDEGRKTTYTEAEFWDVIGTKVLRIFLLAIQSHLY